MSKHRKDFLVFTEERTGAQRSQIICSSWTACIDGTDGIKSQVHLLGSCATFQPYYGAIIDLETRTWKSVHSVIGKRNRTLNFQIFEKFCFGVWPGIYPEFSTVARNEL